jgi:hypothetical protein
MHTVIETSVFIADCDDAGLTDDERMEIVSETAKDPGAGILIRGTGGARKRRFAGRGKGKSGGYRTVSYFSAPEIPVVLLLLIDKGERENMSKAEQNAIAKELASFAENYRAGVRARVATLRSKR